MDSDTLDTKAMQAWTAANVKNYPGVAQQPLGSGQLDWVVDNLKPMIVPGLFANEQLNIAEVQSKFAHTQDWTKAQWACLMEQPILHQVMQQARFNAEWAMLACQTTIGLAILNGEDARPYQKAKTMLLSHFGTQPQAVDQPPGPQ